MILELIEQYDIDTQEELLRRLRENGFPVTQATVSRDINELRLVKSLSSDGGYKYRLDSKQARQALRDKYASILSDCVISVDYAGNTAVVKCHNGMANAACATIDDMQMDSVVGTLAGDDTIFVLFRNEKKASEFAGYLYKFTEK